MVAFCFRTASSRGFMPTARIAAASPSGTEAKRDPPAARTHIPPRRFARVQPNSGRNCLGCGMAPTPDEHRPSVVRRTIGGALDATVGRVGDRVGDAARGVTETTAKQIIEDLEPYLIAETVPRIVDGVTPT